MHRPADPVSGAVLSCKLPDLLQHFHEPFSVCHPPVLFFQFLVFSVPQGGFLDFPNFIFHQRKFTLPFTLVYGISVQFLPGGFPAQPRLFHAGKRSFQAVLRVSIQNGKLPVRVQQRLMLVLSVDIQQQRGDLSEFCCCAGLTVQAAQASSFLYFP